MPNHPIPTISFKKELTRQDLCDLLNKMIVIYEILDNPIKL